MSGNEDHVSLKELLHKRAVLAAEQRQVEQMIDSAKAALNADVDNGKAASGVTHRRLRTLARAVLDLYELIGEQPRAMSDLERFAERKSTSYALK